MRKTLTMAAAVLTIMAVPALAGPKGGGMGGGMGGGGMGGGNPGVVKQTPGHLSQQHPGGMPGASEFAPGHLKRTGTLGGPGASRYAPGHRTAVTRSTRAQSLKTQRRARMR